MERFLTEFKFNNQGNIRIVLLGKNGLKILPICMHWCWTRLTISIDVSNECLVDPLPKICTIKTLGYLKYKYKIIYEVNVLYKPNIYSKQCNNESKLLK